MTSPSSCLAIRALLAVVTVSSCRAGFQYMAIAEIAYAQP